MSGALSTEYSEVLRRSAIARLHRRTDDEIDRLLMVLAANGMRANPWALLACWPESRLVTGGRCLLDNPPRPDTVLTSRRRRLDRIDLPVKVALSRNSTRCALGH